MKKPPTQGSRSIRAPQRARKIAERLPPESSRQPMKAPSVSVGLGRIRPVARDNPRKEKALNSEQSARARGSRFLAARYISTRACRFA